MIVNMTTCPVPAFFPNTFPITIIWNEDQSGADVHKEFDRYIIRLPQKQVFLNIGLRKEIVDKYYDKVLLPFSLIHELLHIYYNSDEFSFEGIVGDNDLGLYGEVFNFLEDQRIEQNAVRNINGIYKYVTVANAVTALRDIKKGVPPQTAFLLEQAFKSQQDTMDHRKADTRNAFRLAANAVTASGLTRFVDGVRNALGEFYRELEEKDQQVVVHVNLNVPPQGGGQDSSGGGDGQGKDGQGTASVSKSSDGKGKSGKQGSGTPSGGSGNKGGSPQISIDLELVPGKGSSGPKVVVSDETVKEVEKGVVAAMEDFLKNNDLYPDSADVMVPGGGYSPGSRKEVLRTVSDAAFLAKVRVEQAPLINYLREKYLEQKIRYQSIYRANDGDYNPERIEELEKMLLLKDDLASPYETPGANKYSRTDVCVVLDQSGSTGMNGVYEDMATMAAVFLVAFEEFDEMRTSLISLKSDVTVCKFFDEPVEATALKPTAVGGTPIDPALRLALKQNWESDLRFVVLISDGIFGESELESLPELRNNMINLVAMSSGEPIPLFDFHLFMKDKKELPERLASFVLPQMIEGFYQEL